MMRIILGALAALCLMGSNCSKPPQYLSTQLDHISSATLVPCDAYALGANGEKLSQRTCLVIANPIRPLLRVYDVSQSQFLLSPIGYSPLGVRVPGLTSQVISYDRPFVGFVFALDANVSQLTAINTRNQVDGPVSFTSAAVRPTLSFDQRPLKVFVANPKGPGNALILASYRDGTLRTSEFDDVNGTFSALQTQATSLQSTIHDAVYDAESGLIAFLVEDGATRNVVVRKAIDTNPNPTTETISDVGFVKLAFGMIKTSTTASPHVLLMRQDASILRTIRLNSDTLVKEEDKEIKLQNSLAAAYIPTGIKEVCCGGAKEWISAASDDGFLYFLPTSDLITSDSEKVFTATASIAKTFNLPVGSLRGLASVIGGDIQILTGEEAPKNRAICWRQQFFIFSSGFVAGICEGSMRGATQIVSRDTATGT